MLVIMIACVKRYYYLKSSTTNVSHKFTDCLFLSTKDMQRWQHTSEINNQSGTTVKLTIQC